MSAAGATLQLNLYDLLVAVLYFVVTVGVGFWVARRKKATSQEYFMGGRRLPWYVVGTSIVAAAIGTQYFIAQVGAAYARGIVISAFGWNAWIVYTLLIWIFLPYYMRTGLFTMPEFLERRFNPASRYIFAVFLVMGYIASVVAGSLYAGGLILENALGLNIFVGILILGLTTGAYTIYGGMTSSAWTDFLQMGVLIAAGLLVPLLGLGKVGGLFHLAMQFPPQFHLYQPTTDKLFPATGVFTGFLSIGIWYNCTSQHLVQRCLAAKDEWNARMGVVSAGFMHIFMPILFVIPGIIAYALFPHLKRDIYLTKVKPHETIFLWLAIITSF